MKKDKCWTEENLSYIKEYYPHFGSKIAPILDIDQKKLQYKASRLKIVLLPKSLRRCIKCESIGQERGTLLCLICRREQYKERYLSRTSKLESWIAGVVVDARKRSRKSKIEFDIDVNFALSKWIEQKGKCYISDIEMKTSNPGIRHAFCASLDRINPTRGYVKDNVAWAAWACNMGKSNYSLESYIDICKEVCKKNAS